MFHKLSSEVLNYYKVKSNDEKFLTRLCKYSLSLMFFTYLPFSVKKISNYKLRLFFCSILHILLEENYSKYNTKRLWKRVLFNYSQPN